MNYITWICLMSTLTLKCRRLWDMSYDVQNFLLPQKRLCCDVDQPTINPTDPSEVCSVLWPMLLSSLPIYLWFMCWGTLAYNRIPAVTARSITASAFPLLHRTDMTLSPAALSVHHCGLFALSSRSVCPPLRPVCRALRNGPLTQRPISYRQHGDVTYDTRRCGSRK